MTVLLVAMIFPCLSVRFVSAAEMQFNLPSASVYIEVVNGTASYFVTTLNGVPSGYDVTNASYPGWCVDVRAYMARSPATHEVRLFSSANPPGELVNNSWDMVNYVLNHKQGNAEDVQQAIWYFVHMGGNYTPTSIVALAIINDSLANGEGFSPTIGQTVAIICYPLVYSHQPDVQISIIELVDPVIPEYQSVLIPTVLILPILVAAIVNTREQKSRLTQKLEKQ
jgi:hypothetical protein